MERIKIVSLVSPCSVEVQELEAFRYIVAGDRGHMEPFMRNEAKYMLKRPVVSMETRLHLTEDDTDLWVTICHIRRSRFRTGAHNFSESHR
jgi:hypothetical protein